MLLRKYRRRRYGKLLESYTLDNQTPYRTFKHLVNIWRRIKWGDFNNLSTDTLLSHRIYVIHKTLPSLVGEMERNNQLIASGRDGRIEQKNSNRDSKVSKTLDAFLSDDDHQPIIVGDYLRQMSGQLQLLDVTVENDYQEMKSDYYPRICSYLIEDIVELTKVIIEGGADP